MLGAVLVDFNRKHRSRAHRLGHGNRKQSNRPAAGDGHALGCDLPGQHRVHRVSQRIENRRVLQRNRGIELPDIRLGNHHVLGERAVGVHANDFHVLADVGFAGAALQALAAGHVHLGGNEVAFLHAGDFIAERGHFAAELVPGNQRRMNPVLRPAVPVVNVQVGAANGRDFHLHQHVGAPESWNLDLANLRARGRFRLHDRQHCCRHNCHL